LLVLGFVVAFAFAPVSRAGNVVPAGMSTSAWHALQVRSEALNQEYAPQTALIVRSEALDRAYGLDSSSTGGTAAQAVHALEVRSDALNQRYQLGRYAVISVSNGFDWTDAGIGAAATLGLGLVLGGVAIVARRTRRLGETFPSMT
jgi:hypothetical protein